VLERANRAAEERLTAADLARQTAASALATASARLAVAVTAAEAVAARAQARAVTLDALLLALSTAVPGAPMAGAGERCWDGSSSAAANSWRHGASATATPRRCARPRTPCPRRKWRGARGCRREGRNGPPRAAPGRPGAARERFRCRRRRIQAVTTSDDPPAERKALVARVALLRDAEHAAREALTRVDLEVTTAQERLRARRRR